MVARPISSKLNVLRYRGYRPEPYDYIGTSTTLFTPAVGTLVLTTQSDKAWTPGEVLVVASDSSPTTRYVVGRVADYDATTLTLTVTETGTNATAANDWTINLGSFKGADGSINDVGAAKTATELKGLSVGYKLALRDGNSWELKTIAAQTAPIQAAIAADDAGSKKIYAISTVDASKYWERHLGNHFTFLDNLLVNDNLPAYNNVATFKVPSGKNGLRIEGTGAVEMLGLRMFQGTAQGLILHCYSDNNLAPGGATAFQIDLTKPTGTMLALSNAWNPLFVGDFGAGNFISLSTVSAYGQVSKDVLATWQNDNVILLPTKVLGFNGYGLTVTVPNGKSLYGLQITHGNTSGGAYALVVAGKVAGLNLSKDTAGGFTAAISNTATGEANEVFFVSQAGTGPFVKFRDGAFAETSRFNKDGTYTLATKQVVGFRQAAIAAPVGGGVVDLECRGAVNLIRTALVGFGVTDL